MDALAAHRPQSVPYARVAAPTAPGIRDCGRSRPVTALASTLVVDGSPSEIYGRLSVAAARPDAGHGEESVVTEADLEAQFRHFVATRSTALLRTAYLLAGDWATAEDLLQISLTKTYLAWKRLGHIDAVEAYARRVLVNTSTSWWRRRWHRERPTETMPEMPAPDSSERHVERDELWRHVQQLPPRQRAVLVLRYYEDMSEQDTARLLGVTVGTVKSQSSRALATLRDRLAAERAQESAAERAQEAVDA